MQSRGFVFKFMFYMFGREIDLYVGVICGVRKIFDFFDELGAVCAKNGKAGGII